MWQIQGNVGQNAIKMLQSPISPVDRLDGWEEKANDISRGLVGFYTLQSFVKRLPKAKSIFLSLDDETG